MADPAPARHYINLLQSLIEVGKGIGKLNKYGQVEAGPIKDILPGDAVSWLFLCSWGCIEGRMDRPGEIEITPLGKHYAEGGR